MEILRKINFERFLYIISTMKKPFIIVQYVENNSNKYIVFGKNEGGVVTYKTIIEQQDYRKIFKITNNVVEVSKVYKV